MNSIRDEENGYQNGIKLLGQGKWAEAEACFRSALGGRSEWPEAHNNLGVVLASRNRHDEALACFRQALRLKAEYPDAHHNLANGLRRAGKTREAIEHYQEAVRLKPGWSDVHNNFALALRAIGELDRALEQLRAALRANPRHSDARNNLGVTLMDKGLFQEAAAAFRQVLRLRPDSADTHNNLGVVLVQQGKLAEAVECYGKAIALRAKYPDAHSNLGNALRQQGWFEKAEASLRTAIQLKPDYAEAYNNLAIALVKQERMDEAVPNYRQALHLKPDYPDARKNLGLALLGMGQWAEGWAEYEYRWQSKEMPARNFEQPRWDGKALGGKTILLYAEQGLGDTIQFIRYAALAEQRGGKVVVECQKALLGLLERCPGIFRLIAAGDKLPDFDVQAPLMSLAGIMGMDGAEDGTPPHPRPLSPGGERGETRDTPPHPRPLSPGGERGETRDTPPHPRPLSPGGERGDTRETPPHPRPLSPGGERGEIIPAEVPYLSAEPERIRRWGEELKGLTGFKIGIAWQGSLQYKDDVFRSIRLVNFEPVAKLAGTRLISLQKGHGEEQLGEVGAAWGIVAFGNKLDGNGGAFLDTAAIMKHLDLVITSDSAVAHLAGALGVPVWLALSKAPDWRWQLERDDNPWYPSMRVFRQNKRGDWRDVFERMARELEMRPPLESAEKYGQRGLALLNQGQFAQAAAILQRGLELDPKNAVLFNNLAVAIDKDGKKDEALAAFQTAVRLKPDYTDALHNLGNQLRRLGRLPEAEEIYRKALKLMPNSPDLCNHLGIALLGQAKHGEAEACFRRSLRLKPDHAEAHNNLGVLLEQLGQIAEATDCYQESIRIKSDSPDTHKNLALSWLMRGDYLRGWAEYEWRWKTTQARAFAQPRWDGRALQGEAVLVYAEQGLGDTIQFVRYAALIQQRGGAVYVEAPGILQRLLARCPGIDRFIPQGAPLPDFAHQIPFLSLPGVFQTTLETVPASVPYLSAEPRLIEEWGQALEAQTSARTEYAAGALELKIGIAWQGSKKYGGDAHRSIPLAEFEPVAKTPGVRLISLQKGVGSEQLQGLTKRWKIVDFGNRLDADAAFADTAALMTNLDLVITSDTAVAHLAGALGVPVWMALSRAADWRWLREGDSSAWYPSMRLFRQTRWGDWREVFQHIASELNESAPRTRTAQSAGLTPAELLDKIAMLEIRRNRLQEENTGHGVCQDLGMLLAARARSLNPCRDLDRLTAQLRAVNEKLWQIEADMRAHEVKTDFGARFVELARSGHKKQDEKAALKGRIDGLLIGQ